MQSNFSRSITSEICYSQETSLSFISKTAPPRHFSRGNILYKLTEELVVKIDIGHGTLQAGKQGAKRQLQERRVKLR